MAGENFKDFFARVSDGMIEEKNVSLSMRTYLEGLYTLQQAQRGEVPLTEGEMIQLGYETDAASTEAQIETQNKVYLALIGLSQ